MRKTNWKIIIFIWVPSFLLISWLFGLGGAIGAGINAVLAYIPVFIVTRLFKLDMNVYYDHKGNKITKEEYEKLDKKIDYGWNWIPKWMKGKKSNT